MPRFRVLRNSSQRDRRQGNLAPVGNGTILAFVVFDLSNITTRALKSLKCLDSKWICVKITFCLGILYERIKTLIHIRLFIILLLVVLAIVACTTSATPTAPPPTPTFTPEPLPTSAPPVGSPNEPGGVEVALNLVTIPDQEAIAIVNGEEIATSAYREELERALFSVTAQFGVDWNDPENTSRLPTFQEQVLDQVVERVLVRQLAGQDGIGASSQDIDAEIASIQVQIREDGSFPDWDTFLAANNFTEETFRRLIADEMLAKALAEKHGGSQMVEHVQASHILVETEEIGNEVLERIAAGEEFSALAAEYSTDPGSKDQGGDLGWFPPGMMVPEFEAAAFALQPGETSDLIESGFGFHIIQVHGLEEREMDPVLFEQTQSRKFQAWFQIQRLEAQIERLYDFAASE